MKKSPKFSAFFDPRVFISFLLLFGAVLLVLGAVGISPTTTASAQVNAPGGSAPVSVAAPQITVGIKPVLTEPLRTINAIPPYLAPGHHHPEPVLLEGATEGAGVDTAVQTTLGPVFSAPAP